MLRAPNFLHSVLIVLGSFVPFPVFAGKTVPLNYTQKPYSSIPYFSKDDLGIDRQYIVSGISSKDRRHMGLDGAEGSWGHHSSYLESFFRSSARNVPMDTVWLHGRPPTFLTNELLKHVESRSTPLFVLACDEKFLFHFDPDVSISFKNVAHHMSKNLKRAVIGVRPSGWTTNTYLTIWDQTDTGDLILTVTKTPLLGKRGIVPLKEAFVAFRDGREIAIPHPERLFYNGVVLNGPDGVQIRGTRRTGDFVGPPERALPQSSSSKVQPTSCSNGGVTQFSTGLQVLGALDQTYGILCRGTDWPLAEAYERRAEADHHAMQVYRHAANSSLATDPSSAFEGDDHWFVKTMRFLFMSGMPCGGAGRGGATFFRK